jgi:hypothetical protein
MRRQELHLVSHFLNLTAWELFIPVLLAVQYLDTLPLCFAVEKESYLAEDSAQITERVITQRIEYIIR